MKNIFVVTDFTPASRKAAMYGIEIARHFGAKLFLFHAYQAPVQVPESYIFYTTEDVWQTVKELLEKEAAAIDPGKTVEIELCASEGAAGHAIITEAGIKHADLIVCGMKETVKGLRRIFGSTTTALVKVSNIPLLVVPEDTELKIPGHIALACDMDSETSTDTVTVLREMGEKFRSKLSVVWVVSDEVDEAYKARFRPTEVVNHLRSMNPAFEFPTGSNITRALEGFAKDHSIDMMAIIPHKHNFLERFFVESTTTNLVFHTHIPLLVLPQKKKNEAVAEEGHSMQNSMK